MNVARFSFAIHPPPPRSAPLCTLVYARPDILSAEAGRGAILSGREFGDCTEAIARKARVFHTFLLVLGSRVPSKQSGERERARARERDGGGPAVAARVPTRVLHNTYFMRDVARGNSE